MSLIRFNLSYSNLLILKNSLRKVHWLRNFTIIEEYSILKSCDFYDIHYDFVDLNLSELPRF